MTDAEPDVLPPAQPRSAAWSTRSSGSVSRSTSRALTIAIKKADPQRAGEIGDLDHVELAELAVGQVVPGKAGQEVGPAGTRRPTQMIGAARRSGSCRRKTAQRARARNTGHQSGKNQRHHDPAEPGAGVDQPDPLEGEQPEDQAPGPGGQVRLHASAPHGHQPEQGHERDPGQPAPLDRRKRRPEQQPETPGSRRAIGPARPSRVSVRAATEVMRHLAGTRRRSLDASGVCRAGCRARRTETSSRSASQPSPRHVIAWAGNRQFHLGA